MFYLDYAKQVGDRYILNFFADAVEDLKDVPTNTPYITHNGTNYGVPLESSVVTIVENGVKVNYILQKGEYIAGGYVAGIDTLNTVTFPYGAETVTYDTTDGITVNAQIQFEYDEDSTHQAAAAVSIPILAGDGISIDANELGDKVVVKTVNNSSWTIYQFDLHNVLSVLKGFRLDVSGEVKREIDNADVIEFINDSETSMNLTRVFRSRGNTPIFTGLVTADDLYGYVVVTQRGGRIFSTFYYFQTLFGNKNLIDYTSGNIDLYRHVVKVDFGTGSALLTIISSKNIVIDSLADLKTYLGDTFVYPCIGADNQDNVVYQIDQDKIYAMGQLTWELATATFTDTVTTV